MIADYRCTLKDRKYIDSLPKNIGGIYFLISKSDGRKYIGSTINFKYRLIKHISEPSNRYIQDIINIKGLEDFTIHLKEIYYLEDFDTKKEFSDFIGEREDYYFETYFSEDKLKFYSLVFNIQRKGLRTRYCTENRQIDVSGEKNPMWGKHHSKESIQRIKDNRRSYKGNKNPNYGKKQSKETALKIRNKHLESGFIKYPEIWVIYIPDNTLYHYNSTKAFSKDFNIDKADIYRILNKKQKSSKGLTIGSTQKEVKEKYEALKHLKRFNKK